MANMMLAGDDTLEVSLKVVQDSGCAFDVRLAAVDVVSQDEKIIGYQSLTGTGADSAPQGCGDHLSVLGSIR